ncbi:MAG: hypothetical protein E7356_03240 [Clostridiales bacterium]|nr:hypothetical protein [Clostridiales bacterium]
MVKIILYISAFVPMYLLFILNLVIELINKNLTLNITNTVVLVSLTILTLIGFVGLMWVVKSKSDTRGKITIISKKNLTDQHFLNYFSLFVLLALAFDLSKICFVGVFVAILIFIGVVYIKNNIYYVNPLLNILGYSFYDIVYLDESGKEGELRIFYKGELETNGKVYLLSLKKKNLNFLEDDKSV